MLFLGLPVPRGLIPFLPSWPFGVLGLSPGRPTVVRALYPLIRERCSCGRTGRTFGVSRVRSIYTTQIPCGGPTRFSALHRASTGFETYSLSPDPFLPATVITAATVLGRPGAHGLRVPELQTPEAFRAFRSSVRAMDHPIWMVCQLHTTLAAVKGHRSHRALTPSNSCARRTPAVTVSGEHLRLRPQWSPSPRRCRPIEVGHTNFGHLAGAADLYVGIPRKRRPYARSQGFSLGRPAFTEDLQKDAPNEGPPGGRVDQAPTG